MKKYKRGKTITICHKKNTNPRNPTQEQLEEGKRRRRIEDMQEQRELARLRTETWFETLGDE